MNAQMYSMNAIYARQMEPMAPPEEVAVKAEIKEPTRLDGDQAMKYEEYKPVKARSSKSKRAQSVPKYVPPKVPTEGVNKWALAQRDTYFQLEEEEKELVGTESQVTELKAKIQELTSAKKRAEEQVNVYTKLATETKDKLAEDSKKAKAKLLGFLPSVEREIDQSRSAHENAVKGQERAQAELQKAINDLEGPAAEYEKVKAKDERRKAIEQQKQQILKALFEGFSAGDNVENEAENAVNTLTARAYQIAVSLKEQRKALKYINSTVEAIDRIFKTIRSSIIANSAQAPEQDMLGKAFHGALHIIADVPKERGVEVEMASQLKINMALATARSLGTEAQVELKKAMLYGPYMPCSKKNQQQRGRLTAFLMVKFESFFKEDMSYEEVMKNLKALEPAYKEAVNSQAWQQAFVKNVTGDYEKNQRDLEGARRKLLNERIRLIHSNLCASAAADTK